MDDVTMNVLMSYIHDSREVPAQYCYITIGADGNVHPVRKHSFGIVVHRSYVYWNLLGFAVTNRYKTCFDYAGRFDTMTNAEIRTWYEKNKKMSLRDFRIMLLKESLGATRKTRFDDSSDFRRYLLRELSECSASGPKLEDLTGNNQLPSISYKEWKSKRKAAKRRAEQADDPA